ncbi:MAG: CPBP family glutamic-type intramembrane protease [Pseudomonadota bacterium]
MISSRAYSAHEALTEPARATAQIWRLVIGLILIAGFVLVAGQFINQTLLMFLGRANYNALTGVTEVSGQASVLFLLLSFGLLTLGVVVALRVAHNRGFLALLGDLTLFRRQFWSVLTVLLVINFAILILPPWTGGVDIEPNVSFSAWLVILPFALIALFVQVSAEEILFRGYLQQQLAARFRSPLVWLLVPSALFGLGHYSPAMAGENAVILAVWSAVFGLAMADVTARAGTLGPAIAIHLVHNAAAILFVSIQDELSGLALYTVSIDLSDAEAIASLFPVEFMSILISWLGARLALRR